MIKKDYSKPTMTAVTIQQTQMLCVSEITTTGLGSNDLKYTKGTGDMSGAMVKRDRHNYINWDED